MLCQLSSLFSSSRPMQLNSNECDLLVLGGGWTWTFLQPLLAESHPEISCVATTRDGRNGTLKWAWDADKDGEEQYEALPRAKTVLIVFPIKGEGGSRRMVEGYEGVHGGVRWVQLGSTGIFDVSETRQAASKVSLTSSSPRRVCRAVRR